MGTACQNDHVDIAQYHHRIVKLLHLAGIIVSYRLSAETGFKTKVKKAVLTIGDETDVRETCANEDCGKVRSATVRDFPRQCRCGQPREGERYTCDATLHARTFFGTVIGNARVGYVYVCACI